MPTTHSNLKINEYIEMINEKVKNEQDNFFYAFRGQSSNESPLECTATRKEENKKKNNIWLCKNQEKFMANFKMKGFNRPTEKRIFSDLEMLADLRHYGVPSCLIDFTSDFLIALWFSCCDNLNEDG